MISTNLKKLFTKHVAASFDKQLRLNDLVGNRSWGYDLETGLLTFGDDLAFKTQILGTESEISQTWRWGWANSISQIPKGLLDDVRELHKMGRNQHIPELVKPDLEISGSLNGHYLSMIAIGVCQAGAYYRCPYEGGALYVMIKESLSDFTIEEPIDRIAVVFPQVISNLEFDHRDAFNYYLHYYDLNVQLTKNEIIGISKNGKRIAAEFDSFHRLVNLITEKG